MPGSNEAKKSERRRNRSRSKLHLAKSWPNTPQASRRSIAERCRGVRAEAAWRNEISAKLFWRFTMLVQPDPGTRAAGLAKRMPTSFSGPLTHGIIETLSQLETGPPEFQRK
jgi:hypothetical protein